ncbi:MAG TPA: hypothetical protein VK531_12355 [Gemmatimonadales bacterium]|nr:hypothetical protein [Gemmatimonadales bacterium]
MNRAHHRSAPKRTAGKAKLVEVAWYDTHTGSGSWDAIATHAHHELDNPFLCHSVGWLIGRSYGRAGHVVLLQSHTERGTGVDTVTIPAGCIKRVRRLK